MYTLVDKFQFGISDLGFRYWLFVFGFGFHISHFKFQIQHLQIEYVRDPERKRGCRFQTASLISHLSLQSLRLPVAVQYRGIHFEEARTAINGSALRRIERNRRGLTALCAVYCYFDPLTHSRSLGGSYRREPFILRLLTFLAALGRILKFLIAEKCLFSYRPNEIDAAVDA